VDPLGYHLLGHVADDHHIGELTHAIEEGTHKELTKHLVFEVDCRLKLRYLMLHYVLVVRSKQLSVLSIELDQAIDYHQVEKGYEILITWFNYLSLTLTILFIIGSSMVTKNAL
jgi:hypothetical protein